jgi:hypothetical protein
MVKLFDNNGIKVLDTDLNEDIRISKRIIKKEKKKLKRLARRRNERINNIDIEEIKQEIKKYKK